MSATLYVGSILRLKDKLIGIQLILFAAFSNYKLNGFAVFSLI